MRAFRSKITENAASADRAGHYTKTRTAIIATFIFIALMSAAALTGTAAAAANSIGDLFSSGASALGLLNSGGTNTTPVQLGHSAQANFLSVNEPATANVARSAHTATDLGNGKVLLAGGDADGTTSIFDVNAGTFTASANLSVPRANHTATKLSDGRVLIVGGETGGAAQSSTEIFDAASGTFTPGPAMTNARSGHTATLMPNGSVLIVGGDMSGTAEILDVNQGTILNIAMMSAARRMHSAALMQDGRVLIVGGKNAEGNELESAEIFDGTNFTVTGNAMAHHRVRPLLRVLHDGKVQIIGGNDDESMEVYDPADDIFGAHGHLIPVDDEHAALLKTDILSAPSRAALIRPGSPDAQLDRGDHTITEVSGSGKAVVVGGTNAGGTLNTFAVFNSSNATVSTDQLDYSPGQTAIISGKGWQAGETVNIIIHEDPHTHTERRLTATADSNGNFTANYLVERHDLNVTFIIGAKGQTSGRTTQTTFTDSHTVTSISPNNGPTSGGTVVNINGSGFANSSTFAVTFGNASPVIATRTSNNTLTATTPAHAAGTVNVVVTQTPNSGSPDSVTLTNGFTYICNSNTAVFTESMGTVASDTVIPTHESANGFDNDDLTMSGVGSSVRITSPSNYSGASGGANIYTTPSTLGANFQIADINTTGLSSLTLSFGIFKDTTASNGSELVVQVSSDGTNYTALSFPTLPTGSGTTGWYYRTATGSIPATSNLRIRFIRNISTTTQIRIDDVRLGHIATTNPADQTVNNGATASFTASRSGSTVQWQVSTDNGANFSNISGQTSNTYSFTANTSQSGNKYRAVFTDACSLTTFNSTAATLTVNAANAAPVASNVAISGTAKFGEQLTGNYTYSDANNDLQGTSTFRWLRNGTPVNGATSTTYTTVAADVGATLTFEVTPVAQSGASPGTAATSSGVIIGKANSTTTVACNPTSVSYNGSAQTPCTVSVTGAGGLNATPPPGYSNNTNAGTATASYTYAETATHLTSNDSKNFTITPASLTVTAEDKSREYGDTNPTFTVSFGGFVNGETLATSGIAGTPNCTTTADKMSVASPPTYPITCAAGTLVSGNYSFNFVAGKLTVTKANLTISAANQEREYGDANPTFAPQYGTFKNGETATALTTAPTCTSAATATSPVSPPTYDIVCSGGASNNYNFNYVNGVLTVKKATLTVTASNKNREYGDANPTFDGTLTGVKNSENITATYASSATQSSPVGTYSIVPTLVDPDSKLGNYTVASNNGTLTVTAASATITATGKSRAYGAANPAFDVTVSGLKLGETAAVITTAPNCTSAATAASPVGNYAITCSGAAAANYTFSYVDGQLTVTKANLTVTAENKSRSYGAANPALTYTIGGFVNNENETTANVSGSPALTTTAAAASGVGNYPITVAVGSLLAPNYDFLTANGNLEITAAVLTVSADNKSKNYGDVNPALTFSLSGFANNENATGAGVTGNPVLSTTATTNSAIGNYPIKVDSIGNLTAANYSFAASATDGQLTVNARAITVSADAKGKIYGDADPSLTYTVTNGSLISGDSLEGALSRAAGEAVGIYAINQGTLAINSNYTLTFVPANLTISARSITVAADAKSKNYGETDPDLTYKITAGSLTSGDSFSGNLTRAAGENVGQYDIQQGTLALNNNYNLTFSGAKLTINKRAVQVSAQPKAKTYGEGDPALTYQITNGSLATGDSFTGSLTRDAGEAVGDYEIKQGTLALTDNYALSYVPANLSISARAVTITADPKSKIYGNTDPALTYQITAGSLATGDSFSGSLSRNAGESVGAYSINQGSVAINSNYALTYIGANFDITKREITVTVNAGQGKTYGDADPTLNVTVTGSLVSGDAFSGNIQRDSGENVGVYAVRKGTLSLSGNYDLIFAEADFTISARAVTITAEAKSKIYGETDPALTYQITSGSLATGDSFTGSLTRDAGVTVGTYAIQKGTLALNGNYNLTYVGANLSITARPVTVTVAAQSKVYNGNRDASVTLSIQTGGVVSGDTVGTSFTTALFDNKNVGTGKQVTVSGIALTGASAGNYTSNAMAETTANVTPRTLTVTATGVSKVFDGTNIATVILSDNRVANDTLTASYAGAAFDNANIGNGKTVTVSGISISGADAGNYVLAATTVATAANITAAGTATGVSVTTPVQYSDAVTITASIAASNTALNGQVTGTVQFCLNGANFGAPVPATFTSAGGTASLTFNNTLAPGGNYAVSAKFTSTNPNFSSSNSGNAALTITTENATAVYSGAQYFATASPTSMNAQITLSATIIDAADGARGDIRNAVVEFRRDSPAGQLLGSAAPVGLVNPGDPTVGTATTSFSYTLSGSEANSNGTTLTVYVVVKGYYTSVSDLANVSIVVPGTNSVNGGGFLTMQSSSGQFAGAAGSKMNFGYTMKYNNSGKNLQGQANIIVRGADGKVYQIKSNAVDSLAVAGTTYPKTGTFTTKANMTDITDPLNPISLGGNLRLQVDMTDTATGGQNDRIGITLWNSNGGLFFTSNWNGTRTVEQALGGGNVSVR